MDPVQEVSSALTTAKEEVQEAAETVKEKVEDYWDTVRRLAKEVKSDGCSKVLDLWVDCCYEHDIHWRTGKTYDGKPISVREANKRFRKCMQEKSKFGVYSPVSWWRWAAVSITGLFR